MENNQYVLSEEVKSVVSKQDYDAAKQMISQTNKSIEKTGSVINKETKVATNSFTLTDDGSRIKSLNKSMLSKSGKKYHYGVNKVTFHWNYIRVYLNKNLAQDVAVGTLGGATALIAEYVSGAAATFAVGAIGAAITNHVGNSVKGGVWVDYNFLTRAVTGFGWQ